MNRVTAAANLESVHPAQVAGLFYPDKSRGSCGEDRRGLRRARPPRLSARKWSSSPMPESIFPAPIAARAARALDLTEGPRRVVILGPNHRVPLRGLAVHPATAWSTPLGVVPVAGEALRSILPLEGVAVDARPFERRAQPGNAADLSPAPDPKARDRAGAGRRRGARPRRGGAAPPLGRAGDGDLHLLRPVAFSRPPAPRAPRTPRRGA